MKAVENKLPQEEMLKERKYADKTEELNRLMEIT